MPTPATTDPLIVFDLVLPDPPPDRVKRVPGGPVVATFWRRNFIVQQARKALDAAANSMGENLEFGLPGVTVYAFAREFLHLSPTAIEEAPPTVAMRRSEIQAWLTLRALRGPNVREAQGLAPLEELAQATLDDTVPDATDEPQDGLP